MRCESREEALADSARGAQTTMSSSGGKGTIERRSPASLAAKATAAAREASSPAANSPPRISGNRRWVDQSATAAAPGREHSRLISPKCKSCEEKYVYGESC